MKVDDLLNVLYLSPYVVDVNEKLDIFGWDQTIITMLIRKEVFKKMTVTTMSHKISLRALNSNSNVIQLKKQICGIAEANQAVVWVNNLFI